MFDYSREFQVLASNLNFTTAARELGISQPGLSRHMAELEQTLGFKLLERNPVRLTAAGTRYLEGITQAITLTDRIVGECRQLALLENGKLTVAMIASPDATSCMVYDALATMHGSYPGFEYRFDDERQLTIEQAVASGAADVGVVFYAPCDGSLDADGAMFADVASEHPAGLAYEFMYNESFGVWMHEGCGLAGKEIKMEDISSCTVLLSANRKFQTWANGMRCACRRYGCFPTFKMKDVNSVNDFLISLQGNEVVFVSKSLDDIVGKFNSHLRESPLAGGLQPTYPVYLVYREQQANPMLDAFVELFRAAAKCKGAQG